MEAIAKLNRYPTSPRKMRLVVDLIRGKSADYALSILKFSRQACAKPLEKLLRSAIANWQSKNEGVRFEGSDLVVKRIFVDEGISLKRVMPAPQGRAYPIRKRSNHVTIIIDKKETIEISKAEETPKTEEPKTEVKAEEKKQEKVKAKTKVKAVEVEKKSKQKSK